MKYRETRIYHGNYADVQIYPVFPLPRRRKKRNRPTCEMQARLNAENATRRLTRLTNTNFTSDDYVIHLTYKDIPTSEENAKKDVQNFIRRVRRIYNAAEIKLKYIWVTERGARSERIHHHIILSGGVSRTKLERLWGKGYANTKALQFNEKGLEGLVKYITKQPLLFRRWNASKNLKKPIEKQNDYRITKRAATRLERVKDYASDFATAYPQWKKLFGDYEIAEVYADVNAVNGGIYILAKLYKREVRKL